MSGTWHAAEANVCSLSTVFEFYFILTDLAFLSKFKSVDKLEGGGGIHLIKLQTHVSSCAGIT
jgi:hypothetical protein